MTSIFKKNGFQYLLLIFLLFAITNSSAQQKRLFRIAYLESNRQEAGEATLSEFKQSLKLLGLEDQKHIIFLARYAELDLKKLPTLANELVLEKPDLIVAPAQAAARAAMSATKKIPILFNTSGDPIAAGLVSSLAKPGGNITGYYQYMDLDAKLCQLLFDAFPTFKKIAFLYDANEKGLPNTSQIKELELAMGKKVEMVGVNDAKDFLLRAKSFRAAGIEAVVVPMMFAFYKEPDVFIGELNKLRLPTIYERTSYAARGGMLSYGPNTSDSKNEIARMVVQILSGTPPSSIPVQRPKNFNLALNQETATQLGVSIHPDFLARITQVITNTNSSKN